MKKLLIVLFVAVLLAPVVAKAGTELGLGTRYMGVGFDMEGWEVGIYPAISVSPNNKVEMNARLGTKMYPFAFYLGVNQAQGSVGFYYIDARPTIADTSDYNITFFSFKPELTVRYYMKEGNCAPFITASFWKGFGSAKAKLYHNGTDPEARAREEEMLGKMIGSFFSSLFGFSFGLGSEYQVNKCISFDGTLGYFYEKTNPSHINEWTETAGDYMEELKYPASRGGIFGQLMINFALF
jgi:hypothetical protein